VLQIAGAVGPAAEQTPPPHITIAPYLITVDAKLANGEADAACELLTKAIATATTTADAATEGTGTDARWIQIMLQTAFGDRLRKLRRFPEAQAVLTAALSKMPGYANALFTISVTFIDGHGARVLIRISVSVRQPCCRIPRFVALQPAYVHLSNAIHGFMHQGDPLSYQFSLV
jgi:hypothetical protein